MADPTNDLPAGNLFAEFPPPSREEWEEKIRADLGRDEIEEILTWDTGEGLSLRAFYRKEDLSDLPVASLSLPPQALDHDLPWRMRQDLLSDDPDAAREEARRALDGGATDLGLPFRTDGTHYKGLRLFRPTDIQELLTGLPLERTSIHLEGGRVAPLLFAMFFHAVRALDVDPDELSGTVAIDPVASLARFGTGGQLDWQAAAEAIRRVAGTLPRFRPLAVDARPYHRTGARLTEELALTLAAASEQIAQLTERGLEPATVLKAHHFILPVTSSYLLEIAKLRALRHLHAQLAAAYLPEGAPPPAFIQSVTSLREWTQYDPHTNLLRTTAAAAAAVLGGCDVLCVHPYDGTDARASSRSRRLARNTQRILLHEAGFAEVTDAAAGSYFIEQATHKLAERAWQRFQEIEAAGGLIHALQRGTIQEHLQHHRTQRAEAVNNRARVLVGTNHYPPPSDGAQSPAPAPDSPEALPVDSDVPALDPDALLDAADALFAQGRTVGDILQGWERAERDSYSAPPLEQMRLAEAFESLRETTERYQEEDHLPLAFLLPYGPPGIRNARANFARNVLGCAGLAISENIGFDSIEQGLEEALNADADLIILCSDDASYPDAIRQAKQRFDASASPPLLLVAGGPFEDADFPTDAVDAFLYRGMNLLDVLQQLQERLGLRPSGS